MRDRKQTYWPHFSAVKRESVSFCVIVCVNERTTGGNIIVTEPVKDIPAHWESQTQ